MSERLEDAWSCPSPGCTQDRDWHERGVHGVYPLPAEYGDRVRYRIGGRCGPAQEGEGKFVLCWFGITEVWDVFVVGGITVHVHPGLGDTMERVE